LDEVIKLLANEFGTLLKDRGSKSLDGLDTGSVQVRKDISGDRKEELSYKLDRLVRASSINVWVDEGLALCKVSA